MTYIDSNSNAHVLPGSFTFGTLQRHGIGGLPDWEAE